MPKRSSSSIFYCLHWCCICSVTTSLNRTDSILFWSRLIYYVVSSVFLMYFVSTIYYVFRYATISRHAKQFCVQNSRAMYLPNGKVLVHGKGMNVIMCPFMKTRMCSFWKVHSPVCRHMMMSLDFAISSIGILWGPSAEIIFHFSAHHSAWKSWPSNHYSLCYFCLYWKTCEEAKMSVQKLVQLLIARWKFYKTLHTNFPREKSFFFLP